MSRPPAFDRSELEAAGEPLFSQPRHVRFQDVDAAGTAFYPRIIEYFSDTYVAMLEAGGVDVPARLREGVWVAPLVHAEADFLGPMRHGDHFAAEVVKTRVGSTSYAVGYRLRTTDGGRLLAVGHTVHVIVDGATFRPMKVPDEIRLALRG